MPFGMHSPYRVVCEDFPSTTHASIPLITTSLQWSLAGTIAYLQLGVKVPGLGALGRKDVFTSSLLPGLSFAAVVFSVSLFLPLFCPSLLYKHKDQGTRQPRKSRVGLGPSALSGLLGFSYIVYIEHVVFASMFQVSDTN